MHDMVITDGKNGCLAEAENAPVKHPGPTAYAIIDVPYPARREIGRFLTVTLSARWVPVVSVWLAAGYRPRSIGTALRSAALTRAA
jgi:hypothetical protein